MRVCRRLDHRPNVDGICWFCSEVWPKLWQRRPDVRLYIVGRRPAEAVLRLASVPGVEVVGTVPDVRPWLSRAAVAVVPLRIARGVQNKVLEALAMGRAVLAVPLCLQGMKTVPGRHLLTATAPDEWLTELEPAERCGFALSAGRGGPGLCGRTSLLGPLPGAAAGIVAPRRRAGGVGPGLVCGIRGLTPPARRRGKRT